MRVRISAVVCTRNRADYLRKAVASLVAQTLPRELYEIVVVDNGSTDMTTQVLREFGDVPNFRCVHEPVAGLSRARNTGWRSAEGEYVAYMDDDAVATPEWLALILDTFEDFRPRPGAVGGRCHPIWESPRPDWLSDRMLSLLSVFHWADKPVILQGRQYLSICNLAYPRELLEEAGGFREELGRKDKQLLANEENHMQRRLKSMGYDSVYHPLIAVEHHVPASRLTRTWFKQASFGQGFSDALLLKLDRRPPAIVKAGSTLSRFVWCAPRMLLMFAEPSKAGRFRRQCQVLETAGYAAGLWRRGV